MTDIPIEAEETRLLDGRVACFQPVRGYRSAIDPILMQAAIPAHAGDRVLELGCGVGAAALCLAWRAAEVTVTGLDIQAPLIDLARRGAVENGLAGRAEFLAGDLLDPPPAVAAGGFDHVMANPPFQKAGTSRPSPDPVKATATVEGRARLSDWVATAVGLVRDGGTVTVVHHGDRAGELAESMAAHLGAMAVLTLIAREGETRIRRVLVQGTKGSPMGRRDLPSFVLHDAAGAYTPAADKVLRGATLIELTAG